MGSCLQILRGGVAMAKEAIKVIKKAEEEAQGLLEDARQTSNKIIHEAGIYAKKQYEQIISDAKIEAENVKKMAEQDAQSEAQSMISKGHEKANFIRNLETNKLNSAINIVIERIVKANGNS